MHMNEMNHCRYSNIAFISYKREDEAWAKWLQKKLEHYKLPADILRDHPDLEFSERPRHVFKDTTDLSGGVLAKAIRSGLHSSKFLIVICSPLAAKSEWVCKEVQDFIDSGREEYIIPFIVEGEPYAKKKEKECFPTALKSLAGERELLGININENGRDSAAVKVVSRLFDLKFDVLWDRFQREARKKRRLATSAFVFIITFLLAIIASGVWAYLQINQKNELISMQIKETEKEAGITIFLRSRTGITLTKDGAEFLGYVRQVIQQMELLEDRYVTNLPGKVTFGVSSQHYTFTENAFVELVKRFGQERYAFYYNETGTHQILDDVKNRVCDLGILYLSHENEVVMRKVIEENHLVFTELFSVKPHVFLQKDHPLASKKVVSVHDLAPYPRLNFVQGEYESVYFSEELFSSIPVDKEIRVNDRGAIVNFMLGLNAYTISSGIFPKYLNGENIISVPLAENETMHIGYVLNENQELSELGKSYLKELRKYAPANP